MNPSLKVVYTDPGGVGYHCVYYMARLAAELLDAELVVLKSRPPSFIEKLSALLPHGKSSDSTILLVCPEPYNLNSALLLPRSQYTGRLIAWVFDSFWPQKIPRWVHTSRIFDHVFVTEQEDLAAWRSTVHAPVDWLPWGSDVLRLGSSKPDRPCDLLRFGRQPTEWDDDVHNAEQAQQQGLSFHGRPPMYDNALDNQRHLMRLLSDAKFTLSFTNRVSPSTQTHPHREYITGRWTDALAAGAIVAGIPPHSSSVESLLWPEALLDIGNVDQKKGLEIIASSKAQWTPARAQLNYLKSMEHLDWRWRFKVITEAINLRAAPLETELNVLTSHIRALRTAP